MKNIECLLKIILRFRKTLCVVMCVMAVFTICFESVFILNLSNRGTWVKADVSSRNLKYDTAPLQQCQRNKVLGKCFYLRNKFNFWNGHGIANTSGLLKSK